MGSGLNSVNISDSNVIGKDFKLVNQEYGDKKIEIEGLDTENNEEDDELEDVDQTFFQRVKSVMTNKIYLLLCGSLSGLYFVVTGIQYWISDYIIT